MSQRKEGMAIWPEAKKRIRISISLAEAAGCPRAVVVELSPQGTRMRPFPERRFSYVLSRSLRRRRLAILAVGDMRSQINTPSR